MLYPVLQGAGCRLPVLITPSRRHSTCAHTLVHELPPLPRPAAEDSQGGVGVGGRTASRRPSGQAKPGGPAGPQNQLGEADTEGRVTAARPPAWPPMTDDHPFGLHEAHSPRLDLAGFDASSPSIPASRVGSGCTPDQVVGVGGRPVAEAQEEEEGGAGLMEGPSLHPGSGAARSPALLRPWGSEPWGMPSHFVAYGNPLYPTEEEVGSHSGGGGGVMVVG